MAGLAELLTLPEHLKVTEEVVPAGVPWARGVDRLEQTLAMEGRLVVPAQRMLPILAAAAAAAGLALRV